MESPSDRLKAARIAAGYTTAPAAAEAMGVPEPTYMAHENGSRGLSRIVDRYAKFFRVAPEWLNWGAHPPKWVLDKEAATPEPRPAEPIDLNALKAFIKDRDRVKTVDAPASRLRPLGRRIPVVGEVAAGLWREVESVELQQVDEHITLEVQGYERAALFALKVVGASMNLVYPAGRYVVVAPAHEAGIREGDYVIVERFKADLVEVTIKELMTVDGRIALVPRSDDPAHQDPIFLRNDHQDQTAPRIIGVVVADYAKRQRPPPGRLG